MTVRSAYKYEELSVENGDGDILTPVCEETKGKILMTKSTCVRNITRQLFSDKQKTTSAEYIVTRANMFYVLTTIECRKPAFVIVTTNNMEVLETWNTNGLAGIEWFRCFMKRHSRLSI
ncbi:hypothetical protein EOD39_10532 [Acipenser ruthenus]|uniref:Uncharacterized protein n=1 Tax=Acipenser ruthenus TaxID=7906 RepID=A0A444TXJ2_ACIRT|nr:hypothetical protein EOD39_10532 [Acipenser ruthenus]